MKCLMMGLGLNALLMIAIQQQVIAAPSGALINALQQTLPEGFLDNREMLDRTEYFVMEVDLNGDGVKEAIGVVTSPRCGVQECLAYVYEKVDDAYRVVGRFAVQSDNAAIGVLKSKSGGWRDLAAQIYNRSARTVWKKSVFDGSNYVPTYKDVGQPAQVILKIKRGKGTKFK